MIKVTERVVFWNVAKNREDIFEMDIKINTAWIACGEMGRKARTSKQNRATALDNAIVVTAKLVKD